MCSMLLCFKLMALAASVHSTEILVFVVKMLSLLYFYVTDSLESYALN